MMTGDKAPMAKVERMSKPSATQFLRAAFAGPPAAAEGRAPAWNRSVLAAACRSAAGGKARGHAVRRIATIPNTVGCGSSVERGLNHS
jgi:hypothetical protein